MTSLRSLSLVGLRISLGAYFFYAGVSKVIDPAWSAAGYLNNAQTFPSFYAWLARPDILPLTNLLNEWGLTLIGVSLVLGLFTRIGAVAGVTLMVLYYLPALAFPQVGEHAYIVDDHIIFIFALLLLAATAAGRTWGIDGLIKKRGGLFARFT